MRPPPSLFERESTLADAHGSSVSKLFRKFYGSLQTRCAITGISLGKMLMGFFSIGYCLSSCHEHRLFVLALRDLFLLNRTLIAGSYAFSVPPKQVYYLSSVRHQGVRFFGF
ncbi:hypothetical protein EmuJ_000878200 [Echinococcus multilocularis]|uniref:Uncharacterized protein n=1 Tax=Echinococcus multilocularis TaxID=6211 RepID=A0A068Y8P8_ECHMU|nr:hypothetical protein EmuJ_000878200 [Echinococcus multilocularis]